MKTIAFNEVMGATCRSHRISVKELGRVLGKPADSIRRMLGGERKVTAFEWIRFCETFNVEPITGMQLAQSI